MLNIEESKEDHTEIYQNASVYIPVELTYHADSGEIKTSCCGEPTVAFHEDRRNGKYCFTIMQPICVEIPIEVSAEALLGRLYVNCGGEAGVLEVSSPEPEQPKSEQPKPEQPKPEQPNPSPTKNWYKVYF